jgi:hypothetical protein
LKESGLDRVGGGTPTRFGGLRPSPLNRVQGSTSFSSSAHNVDRRPTSCNDPKGHQSTAYSSLPRNSFRTRSTPPASKRRTVATFRAMSVVRQPENFIPSANSAPSWVPAIPMSKVREVAHGCLQGCLDKNQRLPSGCLRGMPAAELVRIAWITQRASDATPR